MQTIFCTECGNKMLYSGAKPKFCSSCGTPMGSTLRKNAKPESEITSASKPPSIREQIEAKRSMPKLSEDETDISSVPHIDSFECDFTSSGNVTYKFEEILENAKEKGTEAEPARTRRRKTRD